MIESLTEFGVIPKAETPQSQAATVDKDSSEGELSDSEQEGTNSGTAELDQLMLTAEEQMDYDSFALASPTMTRAPL